MEVARGTPPRFGNPAPLLRRVAAEVFRLASISRPLMRPRRGVGVSPPGIISRRRRIHPVDRNNNKQFSGPPTTQPARPVRPYCFGAQKDPRGRGEPAGLWPCRPALAVPAMTRKLRPALACAPPRRSRRLPHTARLAEGRTEPDFEPAEPNDRAVVVVGRCSCRTRPQCARTAAFRRAARMCRSIASRCASRPSPETPCLSVESSEILKVGVRGSPVAFRGALRAIFPHLTNRNPATQIQTLV